MLILLIILLASFMSSAEDLDEVELVFFRIAGEISIKYSFFGSLFELFLLDFFNGEYSDEELEDRSKKLRFYDATNFYSFIF